MAKYCLTYDAKDALAWDAEELKLLISETLLENNEGDPNLDADYQDLLEDLEE